MPKRLTPRGEAAPPVEPIITGATLPPKPTRKASAKKPKVTDTGVRYVRNLHGILSRVTLSNKREILLQPRGQRDDMDVVNLEEQEDPKFLANLGLIFEVIPVEDAKAIIAKQRTNTRRESSLWDHLRNEQGKAYEQRTATIEEAFERQGVVVAKVENAGDGRFTENNTTIVREAGPQYVEVPGSPNHPATKYANSVPSYVDPEEWHEFLLWKQFKDAQEAQDALTVTVEPLQHEEEA